MRPLGCTFNEIMRPEQNLCVFYAGSTPNESLIICGKSEKKMSALRFHQDPIENEWEKIRNSDLTGKSEKNEFIQIRWKNNDCLIN